MIKAEKILWIIAVIGIILKFLLISGNGLLLTVSLMSLSMMYYLLGFTFFNNISLRQIFKRDSYKGISAIKIIGTIVFGFSLSIALTGILFKIQSWPGSFTLLSAGLISLFICLVVALIRYDTNKSYSYKLILTRIALIGVTSLFLYFTPRSSLVAIFYRDHPDYVQAVKDLEEDPNNHDLQDEEKRQRILMHSRHKK